MSWVGLVSIVSIVVTVLPGFKVVKKMTIQELRCVTPPRLSQKCIAALLCACVRRALVALAACARATIALAMALATHDTRTFMHTQYDTRHPAYSCSGGAKGGAHAQLWC